MKRKTSRSINIIRTLLELTYYDEEERDFAFEDYKNALQKINVYHEGYTETMQDPYWDYAMTVGSAIFNYNYEELSNLVNEILHKAESDPELFFWFYDDYSLQEYIFPLMIKQKWEELDAQEKRNNIRLIIGLDKTSMEESIENMAFERKWTFISQALLFYQSDKELCKWFKPKDPAKYRYHKHSMYLNQYCIAFCLQCMEDAFCPVGRLVRIQNGEEDYIGVCTFYSSGKIKIIPEEEFSMESFTQRKLDCAKEYDFQSLYDGGCFLKQDERYEFAGF